MCAWLYGHVFCRSPAASRNLAHSDGSNAAEPTLSPGGPEIPATGPAVKHAPRDSRVPARPRSILFEQLRDVERDPCRDAALRLVACFTFVRGCGMRRVYHQRQLVRPGQP